MTFSSCVHNDGPENNEVVIGTENPVICLNSTWKFTMNPPEDFWKNDSETKNWSDIQVPGECAMQGFPIKHDTAYVYKSRIQIPQDYLGKVIKLKFDGVYSYARVWANGNFVRDHHGGFTAWECEITDHVIPGEQAWLTVEITDKKDDLSYGSGYAKHQIGGILRSVWLKALPENYLKQFYISTDLDGNYQNASLKIQMSTAQEKKASAMFTLFDPTGNKVELTQSEFRLPGNNDTIIMPVQNPLKWDAEHPNLYTLTMELKSASGMITYSKLQKISFREVQIMGNQLLINGQPVKLRGACRHDIHPLLGRMSTPEFDLKDVLLAKEANMNFIRTSHYPPSESFLEYCDKYGIYVEDESAVCFVNTHRSPGYRELKQSGPEFEHQYLSQVKEMVHHHRNHPSVIIWSTGNESKHDEHLQNSYNYIKSVDPTRPIMTSYPGMVSETKKCYDILSMHYPGYQGNIEQYGIATQKFEYEKMPALYDEWAHVACYNLQTLQSDPYVREFWGQSLDSMWMNIFNSRGGLGGAIWGYIDETFMMPESLEGFNKWWGIQEFKNEEGVYKGHCIGYGEWGIIDTWRRKKPEFWSTKKAYSPTRILLKVILKFKSGKTLQIPVFNRFDHTNFKELNIEWEYQSKSRKLAPIDISPHQKGTIRIPAENWKQGEFLKIRFYNKNGNLIDDYNLRFGNREISLQKLVPGNLMVNKDNDVVLFTGENYSAKLDLNSGLIKDVISKNDTLIKSGPYLNILAFDNGDWATRPFSNRAKTWKLDNVDYSLNNGIVSIITAGTFDDTVAVEYKIRLDAKGTIIIHYSGSGAPEGKFIRESGIKFITGEQFETLAWDRNAYWTAYPDLHLGMPSGEINLNHNPEMEYRIVPNQAWENDMKDFYYQGIHKEMQLSKIARATKENIYSYSLHCKDSKITVFSEGNHSCRFEKTGLGYVLNINNQLDYYSLLWGNYQRNIKFEKKINDTVYLTVE